MLCVYYIADIVIIVTKLALQSLYTNMCLGFIINDANVIHIFN